MNSKNNNCVRITIPLGTYEQFEDSILEIEELLTYFKKLRRSPYSQADKITLAKGSVRISSRCLKSKANGFDNHLYGNGSYKGAV